MWVNIYCFRRLSFQTITRDCKKPAHLIIITHGTRKVVKEIATGNRNGPRNDNNVRISLDGIKNGVYFVQIGNEKISYKLLVA